MIEALKALPEILKAVTDPFSLLALIVVVLGGVAYSALRSNKAQYAKTSPWFPAVTLAIVAISFVALAFNVIRVTSLQKIHGSTTNGSKFSVQVTFTTSVQTRQAVTVPFRTSSGQLNVGCGDSASTSISWNVPSDARDINPQASWERTDNIKSQNQQVSRNGTIVSAIGSISGQDRQWTGNCPGGGHGELVLSGTYVVDQNGPSKEFPVGTFQDTVAESDEAAFGIPPVKVGVPLSCEIRITSTTTNLAGVLNLQLRVDQNGASITNRTPSDSKINAKVSGSKLVVSIP